jgi:5-methyltetrahydropteroyltriglutamate--homocysteine methyltransferase
VANGPEACKFERPTHQEHQVSEAQLNPPFRADHVGSLLRPREIFEAREKVAEGVMTKDELREVEDGAIAAMIPKLEATGLEAITDGEFRRAWFHLDFLEQLDGVTVIGMIASSSDAEGRVGMAPPKITVTGKLAHQHDIQVADYEFVASHTDRLPKVCIPSPTMAHFRGGRAGIDIESYPDLDVFFEDLAQAYRDEIAHLYGAGCRYIQLDDTNLAYLCDPKMRQGAIDRGDDPDELPRTYAALINSALRDAPDDMTTAVHLCRGNYKSTFFASGGYEPVAEVLFNELAVDAYFLEYDDERSGDFAPLRFLPTDKTVVLGLVTSKTPELESQDDLLSRIDDASGYVSADQLCLSPQCGFASTMEGNALTEDDQWEKLGLVVATAERAWG